MRAPVLVLGATGVVGRGIVRAIVDAGVPVIAVARDPVGLSELAARHPGADLVTLAGSVADDADSAALVEHLRALARPLAGVIVAIAGPALRGRLLDQPSAALCLQLQQDVQPHLAAARHLLPLLAQAGRGAGYVLIGGPGSVLPWSGYAHRSVGAAALRMLARALHDEALPLGVRVQLLSVDTPVRTDDARAAASWPTAVDIGRQALALLSRHDGPQPVKACAAACKTNAPQAADSDAAPSRAGWLQDARVLLQSLLPPASSSSSTLKETPR
jgi:NAD(P)-dependent dehydrogenase (short-subunit alcohol dehydrogenase family)